jgi:hypothetical protein
MPRLLFCAFLLCFPLVSYANESSAWPKMMKFEQGEIVFYQPQPNSLNANRLYFDMAIAIKLKNNKEHYGALQMQCRLDIDSNNDSALCSDFKIVTINFPALNAKQKKAFAKIVMTHIANRSVLLSKTRLESSLQIAKIESMRAKQEFVFSPPSIYFTTKPTALILIDGKPRLKKLLNSNLKQVLNTAFILLYQQDSGYYLLAGNHWLFSPKLEGKWQKTDKPPKEIALMMPNNNQEKIMQQEINNIIVSTKPAALIQFDGQPKFVRLEKTNLLYAKNSKDNVFMQTNPLSYFILLSGRWYQATQLASNGNWQYVPPGLLPKAFKSITNDSQKSNVLASIPGTNQAQDAVIKNHIPQTAIVKKSQTTIEVSYDGLPQFKKITNVGIRYAINADKPVFEINGLYYANDAGIWFVANSPTGKWGVTSSLPETIYDIPPENPYYYTTYNYVYGEQDDEVYVGYTPGYENSYIYGGNVIYGTGYDYTGWVGNRYYGYPITWGFGFNYYPHYGWYPIAPNARSIWFGTRLASNKLTHLKKQQNRWFGTNTMAIRQNVAGNRLNNLYKQNIYRRWPNETVRLKNQVNNYIGQKFKVQRRQNQKLTHRLDKLNLKQAKKAIIKPQARINLKNLNTNKDKQWPSQTLSNKTSLQALDKTKLGNIDPMQLQQLNKTQALQKEQLRQYNQQQAHNKAQREQQQRLIREKEKQRQARKNNIYAGRDGNVYKNQNNQWQRITNNGWQQVSKTPHLNRNRNARNYSNRRYQSRQMNRGQGVRRSSGSVRRGGGGRRR